MISGKVYQIWGGRVGEKVKGARVYIGSTTKDIFKRLQEHEHDFIKRRPRTTSYEIIKTCDYGIEILETVKCSDIRKLHNREYYYIKKYLNNCVNIRGTKK